MGADEAKYVFRNTMDLMTRKEAQAFRHISGTMKATMGRSDVSAQKEVKGGSSYSLVVVQFEKMRVPQRLKPQ